nr:dead-box atp-dependent rna helicase 40 [Quercus suber]
MATAEPAAASLGPRYAPDDPTLRKPWKGLIDGSTGVLYYWNPETNVTQYEKPASLAPPMPVGQPTVASTPKLAAIPMAQSMPANGVIAQHGQQITQAPQQQGQHMSQLPQQHSQLMAQQQSSMVAQVSHPQGSQMVQGAQQHGSQMGQHLQQQAQPTVSQPHHFMQQMMQYPAQHIPQQQPIQHMPQQSTQQVLQQPGQQMPQQAIQQMPQQLGQQTPQHQGSQMAQPQAHQFTHPQLQYMAYQQSMIPQGQQSSQQQAQHDAQGQQFANQQEYKAAFPNREEVDFQNRNQIGFSPSQFQQPGTSSIHNLPAGSNSVQMPQMGVHSGQAQQYGGSLGNMQQPSMGQLQQTRPDLVHQQHGPRFQNQLGPAMMHSQQSNVPPVGSKMGHEDNLHGRTGNEYYFNANKEGPTGSQDPKLAVIPMARNPQEMRISGAPFQSPKPGHANAVNAVAGHAMHMHGHAAGGPPFSSNALMRSPFVGSTDVTGLSPVEVYRQQHEVSASGDNVPAPFMTFEETGFPPEILREIYSAGFSSPTPIQAQTWPIALQSRDIVAIAKTGSGKTLGYLIPAFMLLRHCRNDPQNGPTVLVLAPTRELATQIQEEVMKFGRSSGISCTCLYGGASKGLQLKELDRGADIVVATPGRLNDILESKKIDFRQVSLLVLDEADRMLDMGFEPQIRKIVNEIPPRRQTLMYTATWPKEVRKIAGDLLVNPVQVNIGSVDELAANKAITQYVEVVPQMEKQRRLEQILRSQERGSKIIIFCSTKRLCDQLARSIGRSFGAAAIHGDKSQGERDYVLNQFRSGKSPILVATDVAARGLDIKDIRVVINYDFPTGVEDYVHRIGRTGRAGATGMSYTFFSEQDWKYAADLIKVLEGANQLVPQEVREIALRGAPGFVKDRGGISHFDSGSGGGGGYGRYDSGGRGGMRDGAVSGHGGRSDFFPGRSNRGRGFGGPGGSNVGWGRNERGPYDRYNNMDGRGRGRTRGNASPGANLIAQLPVVESTEAGHPEDGLDLSYQSAAAP